MAARGPIFPSDAEHERRRSAREQAAIQLARLRERGLRAAEYPRKYGYPCFGSEAKRDAYLAKLIGHGYQVKRAMRGNLFTVRDIDHRVGH